MGERTKRDGAERAGEPAEVGVLCLVPPDLGPKLLEPLRRHFADDPQLQVLIEHRTSERRSGEERRRQDLGPPPGSEERRKIRNAAGRRIGERRATLVPIDPPRALPRRVCADADRISFCERVASGKEHAQDLQSAREVTQAQAGDIEAFASIYKRYFDRVFGYLQVVLGDRREAEDATQQVFVSALEALGDYEYRGQPLRAWIFRIARNRAMDQLRQRDRVQPLEPEELQHLREEEAPPGEEASVLNWISDRDLLLFIERLPLAQRQVLMLRYNADLSSEEIAEILDRTPADVRMLQSRALRFLRERLAAMGRRSSRRGRIRMRRWAREAPVLRSRRWALHI